MTTLLIAAIAVIKFDGGTPNDFAAALADNLKQSVVVSLGDAHIIDKAEIDTTDLDTLSRSIRTQTKVVMEPGSELIFNDQLLARDLVQDAMMVFRSRGVEDRQYEVLAQPKSLSQRVEVSFVGLPAKSVVDGKVTYKTEKLEALQAKMLYGGLGKPVEVHWIYERAPIFVNVKEMPVLDFAKWVARAIGARVIASDKDFRFELDPSEIRKRAIATIKADVFPNPESGPNEAEMARTFRVACVNTLTTKQVSDALASPGASTRIVLSANSPLTRLAIQRIRQLEDVQRNYEVGRQGPRNAIGLLQRIDNSRPAVLIVNSRFGVNMEIPVLDRDGRPAGIVRL